MACWSDKYAIFVRRKWLHDPIRRSVTEEFPDENPNTFLFVGEPSKNSLDGNKERDAALSATSLSCLLVIYSVSLRLMYPGFSGVAITSVV